MAEFKSKEQKEGEQVSQIDELRRQQKTGETRDIPGNKIPEIMIPEHANERYVYVQTIMKHMDSVNKTVNEVKSLVPIHADQFDRMVDQGGFATYDDVKIVHDPRDSPREKYNFKIEQINTQNVESASDNRTAKGADMKAINEARVRIEEQKKTLEAKKGELDTKEQAITETKAILDQRAEALAGLDTNLSTREAELNRREEELKAREAALKNDGAADQKKK